MRKRKPPGTFSGRGCFGIARRGRIWYDENTEEPHEKDVPNRIPSEVRKMKLLFRQRAFSWFDSYDIYDENENTMYVVKGQFSWGHCLKIYDAKEEQELGTVKQEVLTWLPKFELYEGETCIGRRFCRVGLYHHRPGRRHGGHRVQGTVPLDRHLYSGHRRPGRCAVCADVRAGYRCGEMFAELKTPRCT